MILQVRSLGELFFLCIVIPAAAVGFFSLVFGLARFFSPAWGRRFERSDRGPQFTLGQLMGPAILIAILFLTVTVSGSEQVFAMVLLSLLILAWAALTWIGEFVFLMGLHDGDFPGRHDKLVWAAAILIFAPVGTWAFRSYRSAHWPEAKKSTQPGFRDIELAESA